MSTEISHMNSHRSTCINVFAFNKRDDGWFFDAIFIYCIIHCRSTTATAPQTHDGSDVVLWKYLLQIALSNVEIISKFFMRSKCECVCVTVGGSKRAGNYRNMGYITP